MRQVPPCLPSRVQRGLPTGYALSWLVPSEAARAAGLAAAQPGLCDEVRSFGRTQSGPRVLRVVRRVGVARNAQRAAEPASVCRTLVHTAGDGQADHESDADGSASVSNKPIRRSCLRSRVPRACAVAPYSKAAGVQRSRQRYACAVREAAAGAVRASHARCALSGCPLPVRPETVPRSPSTGAGADVGDDFVCERRVVAAPTVLGSALPSTMCARAPHRPCCAARRSPACTAPHRTEALHA
jgi:hypothetical protein